MWNECLDCKNVFETYDQVGPCPVCGSEYVAELYTCELCKGPVLEAGTKFCECCRGKIDRSFKALFDEIEKYGDIEAEKVSEIVFDRAEEADWYE